MTTFINPGDVTPCPFCGGSRMTMERADRFPAGPDFDDDEEAGRYAYSVRCLSCAAVGPWYKNPGSATWAWNRRPEPVQ